MASALFDLTGKTALVTGSHRGLGFSMARELGRAGARVVISSNEPEGCEAARQKIARESIEVLSIPCDVGVDAELDRLVAETEAGFGPIDILVCNAGINPHFGSLTEATDDEYDAIMRINLRSVVQLCNRVIPGMAERKDGAVILTSSLSGLRGNAKIGIYALSKAAIAQLARNAELPTCGRNRSRLGPIDILGNAVNPHFGC